MKKIIALVFSLILVLSLAACGNKSNMGNDINNGASSIVSDTESIISDITGNNNSKNNNSNNNNSLNAKMTRDEAKSRALKHANLDEKNITGLDIDLDRDDGVLKYEIDFHSGGLEYDYDINAETGEIISSSKDND